MHDQRLSTEVAELESDPFQEIAMGIERFGLIRRQLYGQREQQALGRKRACLERGHEPLVEYAFMRGMLVDQNDAGLRLEHQVGRAELDQVRNALACVWRQRASSVGSRHRCAVMRHDSGL